MVDMSVLVPRQHRRPEDMWQAAQSLSDPQQSSLAPQSMLCLTHACKCHVHALQKDSRLRVEIVAHSRWLTCMDIHPTKVGQMAKQPRCV